MNYVVVVLCGAIAYLVWQNWLLSDEILAHCVALMRKDGDLLSLSRRIAAIEERVGGVDEAAKEMEAE